MDTLNWVLIYIICGFMSMILFYNSYNYVTGKKIDDNNLKIILIVLFLFAPISLGIQLVILIKYIINFFIR